MQISSRQQDSQIHQILIYVIAMLLSICTFLVSSYAFRDNFVEMRYLKTKAQIMAFSWNFQEKISRFHHYFQDFDETELQLSDARKTINDSLARVLDLEYKNYEQGRQLAALNMLQESVHYQRASPASLIGLDSPSRALLSHSSDINITKGQLVFAHGGLVGIVGRNYDSYSEVKLLSSPTMSIAAQTRSGKSKGVVKVSEEGVFNYHVFDGYLSELQEDVVTASSSEQFPQGLYLGYVNRVTDDHTPTDISDESIIQLYNMPVSKLSYNDVAIIINNEVKYDW